MANIKDDHQHQAASHDAASGHHDHSKEKLAEDIAYTVNHAVSCSALDLLGGSPIGSKLAEKLTVRLGDTTITPYCTHPIGWYTVAEVAGDLASVIPTITLQRFAPGVFDGMQAVLEPTLGWAYKGGARRAAHRWAQDHGLSDDDQRVLNYQNKLYKHEVEHLPHAFMWGAVSLPISGAILAYTGHDPDHCGHDHGPDGHHHHHHIVEPISKHSSGHHDHSHNHQHEHHHEHGKGGCGHSHGHGKGGHAGHSHAKPSFGKLTRMNMVHVVGGKIFSSAILLGARSLYPDKARQWDGWASDTIYSPVTKGLSGLLGVDAETVDRVRQKHEADLAPPELPDSKISGPASNLEQIAGLNHSYTING